MCNCKYASQISADVFYCGKVKMFFPIKPTKPTACTIELIEQKWDERLNQVPHKVRQKVDDFLGGIYK